MTQVKYRAKPVWHQTRTLYGGRQLLVAETPSNLLLRAKGTRQVLSLTWQVAWLRAAQLRASSARIEKINQRRVRAVKRSALTGGATR